MYSHRGGPEALTSGQLWSNLVWSILVVFTVLAVTVSSLVWMPLPNWAFCIVIAHCGLACIPLVKDSLANFRIIQKEIQERTVQDSMNKAGSFTQTISSVTSNSTRGMFCFTRRMRVTKATQSFCWLAMAVEVSLFLVYPFASLSMAGNVPLAMLFFFAVGVSAVRHYVDLVALVEETGLRNSFLPMHNPIAWTDLTVLRSLIRRAKYSRTSSLLFQFVFAGCSMIVFLGFVGASSDSVESTSTKSLTVVNGFIWSPTHGAGTYAACERPTKHRFGQNTTLADFVFLSILAYKTDVAALQLQYWFQNTQVVEDSQTVRQFRLDDGFDQSPVFFRLFRFHWKMG